MPDTVFGIPVHPLVVHAVVVLIPLASLGVIATAFVPKWRQRFGGLVALVTVAAVAMVPVATQSGEQLQESVGEVPALEDHVELGDAMIYFALPLLVVAVALWWLGRREGERQPYGRGITIAVGVVSVVVALLATAWIVRVGHSGAESVWSGVASSTSGG